MVQKRGLGKGLGALISTSVTTSATGAIEIPIDQISPNPHQPRHTIDPEKLQELADSIKKHGLIQPLVVTKVGSSYQLIAGERRWRASKLAALEEVLVIVKEVTTQEMVELALVENIQRADLNPLEEAHAYAQLISEFGLTQEAVSERVGKSRTAVANTLRLLNLPDEAKHALLDGKITGGHARALLSLKHKPQQLQALTTIIIQELSVRQTEALVKKMQAEAASIEPEPLRLKPKADLNPLDKTMLAMFESILGTKVELNRTQQNQGKIVIHFFSQEELQTIFDTILGPDEQL